MTEYSEQQTHRLFIHDERFSSSEVIISPEHFPNVSTGDFLSISNQIQKHPLIVQVECIESEMHAKQTHLQISIAQNIANLFDLQPRSDVVVKKIDPESFAADYIEFSFRDQYVGRSHMVFIELMQWNLKSMVANSCVYRGKRLSTIGARAYVKEISVGGSSVPCAYITPSTKAIFRSETAKYFLFIQMSKEMFEFEEDGELFYEKCIYGFLPELFERWKTGGTNHIVSIILFARVFYNEVEPETPDKVDNLSPNDTSIHSLSRDASGRLFRDFYRVLIDWEVRSDWGTVLVPLRKRFMQFQKEILQEQV